LVDIRKVVKKMLTESEILRFISEDKTSMKKQLAKVGQKYYEAEHDILQYRMFYFNNDGNLVEDTTRSNMKIPHPFFTEHVDQAVQYILSGKDENGELKLIKSDIPQLQSRLDEYFDDEFISELSEVLTGTMSKGFDYMYTYKNTEGRLAFQHADSMGVVEVKAKDTDDGCEYVIFWYTDTIAKNNKTITRIQVWDEAQTTFYVQEEEEGKLILDYNEKLNPRPHVTYRKDGDDGIYYENFGFIPFFRLDNNKKQVSDIKPIKPLIDDYDLMSCGLSNNLADFDHPLHVVKGFKGDNLNELQVNLKTKKMIGVGNEGSVEVHTIDIPYQARVTKMQEDEKNIYRFGMAFNSSQVGDGNVTNVVIKSRYALLDLKCNKLEIRLKQFLKKILKVVIAEINKVDGTNYQMKNVYFNFKREIMTNASDNATIEKIDAEKKQIQINIMLSLANIFDDETIIQNICEILDLDYESIKGKLPKKDDDLTEQEDILDGVIPEDDLGGDVIE
jgi:SPP1 family phage portal protein